VGEATVGDAVDIGLAIDFPWVRIRFSIKKKNSPKHSFFTGFFKEI
jgi:hypothetical protein